MKYLIVLILLAGCGQAHLDDSVTQWSSNGVKPMCAGIPYQPCPELLPAHYSCECRVWEPSGYDSVCYSTCGCDAGLKSVCSGN